MRRRSRAVGLSLMLGLAGLAFTTPSAFAQGRQALAGSDAAGHAFTQSGKWVPQTTWEMNGVSCRSARFCEAVGDVSRDHPFSAATDFSYAERWDGRRWHEQRVDNPTKFAVLTAISCWSPDGCIAAGTYYADNGSDGRALVERWDGSRWRWTPVPQPPSDAGVRELDAVSCSDATHCTADGMVYNDDVSSVLLERWDGARWSASVGTETHAGASAISCPATGVCVTIADSNVVQRLIDGSWVTQRLALPSGRKWLSLQSVACASADDCVLVGGIARRRLKVNAGPGGALSLPLYAPLIEHFNGRRWSRAVLPRAAYAKTNSPFFAELTAVSCSAPGSCVTYTEANDSVTLRSSDGRWRVVNHSGGAQALSCPTAGFCATVFGEAVDNGGSRAHRALSYTLTGERWRSRNTPLPQFSYSLEY